MRGGDTVGLIRCLLAAGVVFAHAGPLFGQMFTAGLASVQAFFIISGFYMALILNEKYTTSYKAFYINRFLRLYPSYYIVLLAYVPLVLGLYVRHHYLGPLDSYREHWDMLQPGTLLFLIFTNLALFGQDVVMFLGFDPVDHSLQFVTDFNQSKPPVYDFLLIGQAWTLGVELTFYLFAPAIVRMKLVNLLLLTAASLLLRAFLYYKLGLYHDPWAGRFFPTELALFLFGVIAYRLRPWIGLLNVHRSIPIAFFVVAVLAIVTYSAVEPNIWVFYAFMTVAIPLIFDLTKNSRLDRSIGDLSYVIYISHGLIGWMSGRFGMIGVVSAEWKGPVVFAASVVFSIVVVRLTDPIERYRQRRARAEEATEVLVPATAGEAKAG